MSVNEKCSRLVLKQLVIEEKAPQGPGVYAFWHKQRPRCVYVGRSNTLCHRLLEHYQRRSHNKELHEWIVEYGKEMQFCFIEVDKERTEKMEQYLIKKLKPIANKQGAEK